ncbi:MAG: helical backbone metal receptor [Bacteroidota bacterium]|nr:helical backbone metal receptor [Bacteroidota bacterium]MDP4190885.1 helical backbone metal receptor [Bacteroidota bacterium]MDP4195289.1 helical backbone metal receptor [Bacteroidota bacterium]
MRALLYLKKSLFILLLCAISLTYGQKQLKIVSLAPNWTNITAAIGATEDLVGVTRYCIFPDSIPRLVKENKLQIVSGFMDVNFKKVKELNPDIILTCTGVQAKIRDRFIKEGFKVIHMDETNLEEVYSKIIELGKAVGKEEQAQTLVGDIRKNLKNVAEKYKDAPRLSVYYEINYFYKCVPGKDSYITELIKMVGGDPIYCDRPGIAPQVKWDEVVKADPDVILIPIWEKPGGPYFEGDMAGSGTTTPYEIAHRQGAENIKAIKNGKVRYINSAKTKQAGPQIPTAADLFGKTIHAEGDKELLKMDKVPDNMETTFSELFYFLPLFNNAVIFSKR